MSVQIKTEEDIKAMREVGRMAASVLDMIRPQVQAGMSTGELDRICHRFIVDDLQAIPAPLNYRGFPKSICTSVNHVVCHGIPSDDKLLKNGDIINIDITVKHNGYHGDTSEMFMVGKPSVLAQRLVDVTRECLWLGIDAVRPGAFLGDIGHSIASHAHKHRFSVVREFCGHGIGKVFHEEPQVLHYGRPGDGIMLQPGMIFTIEPMINAGKRHTKVLRDGWTAVTRDRSFSAQWEHTILVTQTGYEVLTLRQNETSPLVA
jgi:methionyl aminopeptidase